MIKAKILALCVCPAAVAPPTILAVNAPARHAFAHMLHRAANQLDHKPVLVQAAALAAELPCAPSIVVEGSGLPIIGGDVIGAIAGPGSSLSSPAITPAAFVANGSADRYQYSSGNAGGSGYAGGGGYNGGGGLSGGGDGSSGGGSGSGDNRLPPAPLTHQALPISAVSGAPEPAAWVFLVIGFGLVGAIGRRRLVTGGIETWPS